MTTNRLVQCVSIYAMVTTTLLAFAVVTTSGSARRQDFDEITVHRIKVVEPDGTLRMVIANHATFNGVIVRGKEGNGYCPLSGMLFYYVMGMQHGDLLSAGHCYCLCTID